MMLKLEKIFLLRALLGIDTFLTITSNLSDSTQASLNIASLFSFTKHIHHIA